MRKIIEILKENSDDPINFVVEENNNQLLTESYYLVDDVLDDIMKLSFKLRSYVSLNEDFSRALVEEESMSKVADMIDRIIMKYRASGDE